MNTVVLLAVSGGFILAFANGANDVSKGIATLVGSGISDYRRAILWGTAWTAAGGILGAVFAGAMLTTFGKGLLASGVTPTIAAGLAAMAGAALWVLIATRTGLPVSTTHAIVGSLAGVVLFAYGTHAINWNTLGEKIFLPLLVSPFIALVLTGTLLRILGTRTGSQSQPADCLCAEVSSASCDLIASNGLGSIPLTASPAIVQITSGSATDCARENPAALRVTFDNMHWLTSGATSLARGMNDSPKIVALTAATIGLSQKSPPSPVLLYSIIAISMVAGSYIAGSKVTHVLAEKVTKMDHQEGFAANLVTALLVSAGAFYGLPMSTTHVSSGGIISTGLYRSGLNRKTIIQMLLAWAITIPAAAGLGISVYLIANALIG